MEREEMGSNQHGEVGLRTSRKGKKSSSEKPKQPQRGLGVAQLEKIRIQNQIMESYNLKSVHPLFHSNLTMMGCEENLRAEFRFGELQSSSARYHNMSSMSQLDHLRLQTLPLMEDSVQRRIQHDCSYSTASLGHVDSNSSDSHELDLELRLSLRRNKHHT